MTFEAVPEDMKQLLLRQTRQRLEDVGDSPILIDEAMEVDRQFTFWREMRALYARKVFAMMPNVTMRGGIGAIAIIEPGTAKYVWTDPLRLIEILDGSLGEGAHSQVMTLRTPVTPAPYWDVETRRVLGLAKKIGHEDLVERCYSIERGAPRLRFEDKVVVNTGTNSDGAESRPPAGERPA